MEVRRHRLIQDQENAYVAKGKANNVLPAKKSGLRVRGALTDLSTNIHAQQDINVGKVAVAAAEFEKKVNLTRGNVKCSTNYSHVQSKVDTGLSGKINVQPSSRPPLRREESTGCLAAKAVRTRVIKGTNKIIETKESNYTVVNQTKKVEIKKTTKTTSQSTKLKEIAEVQPLKPILKESMRTLGNLKLTEKSSLINHAKLEQVVPSQELDTTPELPSDIEDIDDADNPWLMSTYIKDIYRYLKELEVKYQIEPNFLKNQNEISDKNRATLIDWLVELQHQFSLTLETFQLTVGIIDRFLQAVPNHPRSKLQLLGVTAMFIACKYEEIYAPDIGDFVYVTDKSCSKTDIKECERLVMTTLGFCLARPIPLSFLRRFIRASSGTSSNHHMAKYFVDLCLVEYSMAHYKPSELAAAAICLSLYLLSKKNLKDVWTRTLSYYSGYTLDEIFPVMVKIANLVINAETSRYNKVFKKYSDASLAKVSTHPQLKSEVLYELAKVPEKFDI